MAEPLLLARRFPPPAGQKAAMVAHDHGGGDEWAHPLRAQASFGETLCQIVLSKPDKTWYLEKHGKTL